MLEDIPLEENLRILEVNAAGLFLVSQVFGAAMARAGRGSIINVSSRLALSAPLGSSQLPKRAVYAGSKAFINTFTQLLHGELEGSGIRVQALCPGLVDTEFHEVAGIDRNRYPAGAVSKPEDIVKASLAGLELLRVRNCDARRDCCGRRKVLHRARHRGPVEHRATRSMAAREEGGRISSPCRKFHTVIPNVTDVQDGPRDDLPFNVESPVFVIAVELVPAVSFV